MAVSDIQATVLLNTGRTPTSNSVEDAQKFVVSSIPKNLLKWASTETVPATHGGDNDPQQVTLPVGTDNIISVRRDSYSAEEVSVEERAWMESTSGSLKQPTSTFPKYYIADANRVIVKPDPDDTYKIYVMYIDYTKLDDDSDLRNAIINYSTSREFTALTIASSFPTINWTIHVPPISPDSPSFTTPDIATKAPPTFTPPVMGSLDFNNTNNWIDTEEDSEMLAARVQEIQTKISEYTALLQETQLSFNKSNAEYQALVQEAQQETSLLLNKESQEYSVKLQKYQAELQDYQANVNQTIQSNQGQISQWQIDNSVKLGHYSQKATQYYNWAQAEIKSYIENNTKTFDKIVGAQRGN